MKLNPDLVGTRLKPYQTQITSRQTTNYAVAIQDNNSVYFDDRKKEGIVGHPLFPVSVTWPVLSRLDQFIEAKDFPMDVLLTQVHYSEHLILHRLIRPDDLLTLTGSLNAFLPHRAGTHAIIALEAVDGKGALVFTEYIGAMLRGVDCGLGKLAGELPVVPETKDEDGLIWQSNIFIDPLQPYVYDGCTNIEFPIHTSPNFAQAVGLPGIILQGTSTLAYAVREMVNREANMDPSNIEEIACNFTGMVKPGTQIQVCCTEKKAHQNHINLFFQVKNHENQKAIRNGYIKIKRGSNGE
jgi:acyl dehydratase